MRPFLVCTHVRYQAVPFLSIVQPHKLDFLTGMFRYKPLRKGDVLFNEGDLGLEMYIVLNGAVSPRASNAAANVRHMLRGAHQSRMHYCLSICHT